MHSLVKEHVTILKLKGNKIAKRTEIEIEELQRYISFLERKRNATFKDMPRFCVVTMGLERITFSTWDDTINRAEVRVDRRGFPFAVIDFSGIPSASRRGAKGEPFYNLFMTKFMEYKLPTMREPHVWLKIVEQEKLSSVTKLYKDTIKFQYNIFHITYMPAKDKNDHGHQRGQGQQTGGSGEPHLLDVQCA